MASKKLLIREIVDYIDKQYKNDPRIVELVTKYNSIEEKLARKRIQKTESVLKQKTCYIIPKQVRDWLEPLVDAEYFKHINYHPNDDHADLMVLTMQKLETEVYKQLLQRIEEDSL